MTNPLMRSFLLPPFADIKPEHILPAIQASIDRCYQDIKNILSNTDPFTWENLCQPLADTNNRFNRIWSTVCHLNSVTNNDKIRNAYKQSLKLVSEYSTWLGQHKGLYSAYNSLRNSINYSKISLAQKQSLDNAIRDFKLSGIELTKKKRQRYSQIISRISDLTNTYSNNVLDATLGWSKLVVDKNVLSGMPTDALNAAYIKAQNCDKEGWLLTLDLPTYLLIMTYCDNAKLRKEVYYAYNTRASDQGPNAGTWDNTLVMNEILSLRHELAQLLGFKNYANKSLFTKMANNPKRVLAFITDLSKRIRLQGKQELEQLRTFVQKYYGLSVIEPWDIAYYSEKQKQHLFFISDEQLRPYFPEKQVISGLFEVVKRIYGVDIKARTDVDTWCPDVRFFDIFDANKELCGSFYLDLYVRKNKMSGAWMSECASMMRKGDGSIQKPIAYIVCNFNCPIMDKPALLSHNEVITLFHEFGHGLHHIMTKIDTFGVSGIDGVPLDAIELPSQFMENYCWHPEALALISGHYKTGDPLPNTELNRLLATKHYQSAMFVLRQLEFSLFDLLIHYQYQPDQGACLLETLAEVKKKISVTPSVTWARFPHTFSHIFAGSYAAGYYSYLWSEVLAADIWSRFNQEGIFNRNTGKSFLKNILSRGGSEDPMILFTRFRGRKPCISAMLKHYGIKEANKSIKT